MTGVHPPDLAATRRLIAEDRRRLLSCMHRLGLPDGAGRWTNASICVTLHRYAHWLHANRHPVLARAVWQINQLLTGADISPASRFGAGLVIFHPTAVTLAGCAGERFTVDGLGGLGGGLAMEDVGAGPGLPVLGDDVHLGLGAAVLGPVRVGDRVRIGPGCTIVTDLADDTDVPAHPVRVRRVDATPAP